MELTPFDSQCAGLRPTPCSLRTFDVIGGLAMSEPGGSPQASREASRMVRKKGLEPSRPCGRQPLKLVRLPIPPLPRGVLSLDAVIARPAGYQPKDKYTADPWRRQPR